MISLVPGVAVIMISVSPLVLARVSVYVTLHLSENARSMTSMARNRATAGPYAASGSHTADLPIDPPPSTNKTCPVMNPASSESRKAIVAAISSGLPRRRMGLIDRKRR